jgi:hypothetical protein
LLVFTAEKANLLAMPSFGKSYIGKKTSASQDSTLKRAWKVVELRQGLVSQGCFDSKRLCLG